MSEPAIRKALTAEKIFLKQDKERYLYEMREKALLDHVSAMEGAKEEGRVEGRTEGRAEAQRETALRLLNMGMALEDIAKATGLSGEELQAAVPVDGKSRAAKYLCTWRLYFTLKKDSKSCLNRP